MSETKKLNVGDKFAHATVGNVADFSGKAFLKEVLGLTGAEVSLGTLTRVKLYRFPCTQRQRGSLHLPFGRGHIPS